MGVIRCNEILGLYIGGFESLVDAAAHDGLEGDVGTEEVDRPLGKDTLIMLVYYLELWSVSGFSWQSAVNRMLIY